MKPASFSYHDPRTIDELLKLLAECGSEAKLLAGGQSLIPMMVSTCATSAPHRYQPNSKELSKISVGDEALKNLVRWLVRLTSNWTNRRKGWPTNQEALGFVGHIQTRSRGTVGGSLAQNDPAAELPAVMLLLGATVTLLSRRGARRVAMDDFFEFYLSTVIAPDECLTEIEIPSLPPGAGATFMEVSRRHGDFALVAAAAVFIPAGGERRPPASL